MKPRVAVHWFRRDLRLEDNHGLYRALTEYEQVLPLFIFDATILDKLEDKYDRRVDFIHRELTSLHQRLVELGSGLHVEHGQPLGVWKRLLGAFDVTAVVVNHDHEPYCATRDIEIADLLSAHGIPFRSFKDISIFERGEITKDDGLPYTVYTPYMRKWRDRFSSDSAAAFPSEDHLRSFWKHRAHNVPNLADIGFSKTDLVLSDTHLTDDLLRDYPLTRNLPGTNGTSNMSTHLRFGTVSVRELMRRSAEISPKFLNELIWREFYMQILWHFPNHERAFKPVYDRIAWRKDEAGFHAWCEGRTGYPLVDAGMRELNSTGLMHNRVRMVAASFLTKHLLIDWRWGEAYFAAKLLDFELSSNNGGWQWASGSGCDAAPYFRVFNPTLQMERYDPQLKYVKKWLPEYGSANYVQPMVVHELARQRAIETYKEGLDGRRNRSDHQTQLFK